MTNRKTKTVRKIGPASTTAILPPPSAGRASPRAVGNRTCHNSHAPHPSHSSHSSRATRSSYSPINPIIHKSNNPSAPRTRNGKVARLPFAVRDMINRMLRNNIPHSQIVAALDELNFKVTERNISNWKTRGGYRDWCIAQDRALETRLLQDNLLAHLRTNDASQLAEVGLQLVATELSQFFLKSETRKQLTDEPEKFARTIGILCRLARQIHILQKYRDQSAKELGDGHNHERIKRETDEFLESLRDNYSSFIPDNAPVEPSIPHRNFLPKNGYPADPPDDTPEDLSHIDRNIQFVDAFIAARRAEAESQFSPPPKTAYRSNQETSADDQQSPSPGRAARAASSEPSASDDSTLSIAQPAPTSQ